MFEYINKRYDETNAEAKISDKEFIEDQVITLDQNLTEIYPFKGNVEV